VGVGITALQRLIVEVLLGGFGLVASTEIFEVESEHRANNYVQS
jgi:hypothetical protein